MEIAMGWGHRTVGWRHVAIAMAAALLTYAFLDAAALRDWADALPIGPARTVAVAVTVPLARASAAVGLDAPDRAIRRVKGTGEAVYITPGEWSVSVAAESLTVARGNPISDVNYGTDGESSALSLATPSRSHKMDAAYHGRFDDALLR